MTRLKLADGVIATSTLVEKDASTILMKDNYVRVNPENKVADIHYAINKADMSSKELKS